MAQPASHSDKFHAFLNKYKAKSLPSTLWRVTDVHTRGRQPSGPGFDEDIETAEGPGILANEQGLKTAIHEHFNWLHREESSPLLSTLSNMQSASQCAEHHQYMAPAEANLVFLHEIDTAQLSAEDRKCIFSVDELKEELGLDVPDRPENQGEYLFLWSIPWDAIASITVFHEPGIIVDLDKIISASCRRREEMRLLAEMKEDKN